MAADGFGERMEERAVIRRLEHWRQTGDAEALQEGLAWLERWMPLVPAIVKALGLLEAEEVRAEVIEKLLLGDKPPLLVAAQPRALARRSLHNAFIVALRNQRRQLGVQVPGQAQVVAEHTHGSSAPKPDELLDEKRLLDRVVRAMETLRLEERAALLLLHAPDRLTEEDWRTVAERHPPPVPLRPGDVLEREDIAALLFPGTPEATAYERVGKQLQRAYTKLRRVLATPEDIEEDSP
ncbi:hypothetical protein JYK02_05840 [Corallococcus macrosporus]|uniref:Uncharacterized protein n=1 Tax=Corallococcus macrosporus TaxID=35 RepID=A0ABS3D5T5_9BACT|nr:hypothetical protein [Corallococcus macrosporus]MBN8227030.1 hypothetical protein [Corallococcus macrosporus]